MSLSKQVQDILSHAHKYGYFTTKSDFARHHADLVAMLACEGLLTTRLPSGHYNNRWRITAKGLDRLENPHAY